MCKLLDSIWQVVDFIGSLERINDLEIKQCVNFCLYIVLRYHILLGEVIDLFTEINGGGIHITAVTEHHDRLGTVDKRDNDVDTRLQSCIIASQTLYNLGFGLRDDHKGHLGEDNNADDDGNQYISHNVHDFINYY